MFGMGIQEWQLNNARLKTDTLNRRSIGSIFNSPQRERFFMTTDISLDESEHISLCEALDRILNKGAVIVGEVTISVANIDLVYLGAASYTHFH